MGLKEYWQKRDFKETKEPRGTEKKSKGKALSFVIQKHDASHLHYDFRLELDGVLKSWAVPKGPSLDPKDKRMAVQVEDHPMDYASFEGSIPEGEYGGGDVIVWDRGQWIPKGSAEDAIKKGRLEFELKGEKLHGQWVLVRTGRQSSKPQWLLIKRTDDEARASDDYNVTEEMPESVKTGELLPRDVSAGAKASGKTAKAAKKAAAASTRSVASPKKTAKKAAVKKKADKFPGFIKPQLAKLVEAAPSGAGFIHEIKFDGYRLVATVENGEIKMYTRSGLDWTPKFEAVAKAMKKIKVKDAIFDGEVVTIDEEGRSDFSKLQLALSEERDRDLVYFVFDLLWLNGEDLRDHPLLERKALLEKLLAKASHDTVRYSEHWQEDGPAMLQASCRLNMEGIISKEINSVYESRRSGTWLKSKCGKGQEFVIGGFTTPRGERNGFGAVLLGAKDDDGQFRYVGRVGTGFTEKTLRELTAKFKTRVRDTSPFDVASPKGKEITFIKPDLVAQITFGEWTADQVLRHATFQGLREDKSAELVVIEKPKSAKEVSPTLKKKLGAIKKKSAFPILTHPSKLMYPTAKISKERMAEYYENVSKWILPHAANRPLSLVRCPDGAEGECFFQKKLGNHKGVDLHTDMIKGRKGKTEEIISLDNKKGFTELVQMGVLEIHAWGCKTKDITKPDLIVFDLDPEESVQWKVVRDTAFVIRDLLEEMKLKSFVKTTGGKGLHIHVPIVPEHDFDQVKAFSLAVVKHLEKQNPEKYTTAILKSKRHGRIFLDYLRNGYGATAVVPYSLRSKKDATVAVPITWDELKKLKAPNLFKLADVEKRLATIKDPWAGYFKTRQKLRLK